MRNTNSIAKKYEERSKQELIEIQISWIDLSVSETVIASVVRAGSNSHGLKSNMDYAIYRATHFP